MKENNGKSPARMNIGGASIILLLLVFAMTVFAILSIRASYYELDLAKNSRDAVQQYYLADSQAEELYMEAMESRDAAADYDDLVSRFRSMDGVTAAEQVNGLLSYGVAVNSYSSLNVTLDLDTGFLLSWKTIVEPMDGYSEKGIEVWQPVWEGSDIDLGDYSDLDESIGSLENDDLEEDEDIDLGDYDDLD